MARPSPAASGDGSTTLAERQFVRKKQTIEQVLPLLDIPSKLHKRYRKTLSCRPFIISRQNAPPRTSHCGQPWCLECSLREARRKYRVWKRSVQTMADPHHVVLTAPLAHLRDLSKRYDEVNDALNRIRDAIRKTGGALRAIRKIETVVKPANRTWMVHAHVHLLLDGLEDAKNVRRRWQRQFRSASDEHQKIEAAYDPLKLLKYMAKARFRFEGDPPPWVRDSAYQALSGKRRTWSTWGLTADTEEVPEQRNDVQETGLFEFDPEFGWVDRRTGELWD